MRGVILGIALIFFSTSTMAQPMAGVLCKSKAAVEQILHAYHESGYDKTQALIDTLSVNMQYAHRPCIRLDAADAIDGYVVSYDEPVVSGEYGDKQIAEISFRPGGKTVLFIIASVGPEI